MEILLRYFSDFSERQIGQFRALEELYREWNAKINVISRKDIGSLYEKHVLHSLSIAAVMDFPPGIDIIDYSLLTIHYSPPQLQPIVLPVDVGHTEAGIDFY